MIVLWGLPGDEATAAVHAHLRALGRTALLLDQRAALEQSVDLTFDAVPSGWIAWGAERIDLRAVTAVYMRPYQPLELPDVVAAGAASPIARHALAIYDALRVWSELTPALVVNRLSASASNRSKPYQAELIRAAGFSVPETLITTDPLEAREFCARAGEIIYKSISSQRSIVSRITAAHADRFAAVSSCPTQLQRRVPGVDVRVHVVADDIFACEIQADPSVDDYRYPGDQPVRRVATELDPGVADRCRALARALDLPVAGIDLRRTPAGAWFCFEVNPSPGFTAFDDGRIGRRLAELLAAGRN